MQSFCFFGTPPSRCLFGKRSRGVGATPPQNKNLKNKFLVYIEIIIFLSTFLSLSRCGLRQKVFALRARFVKTQVLQRCMFGICINYNTNKQINIGLVPTYNNQNNTKPIYFYYFSISLIKLTISIAPIAESKPLLPALVPALSIACSMFSVVSTPNITGISELSETLAIPLDTSAQT